MGEKKELSREGKHYSFFQNRECEYFVPLSLVSRVNHSIPDQKLR